jgi:hypothetical protein
MTRGYSAPHDISCSSAVVDNLTAVAPLVGPRAATRVRPLSIAWIRTDPVFEAGKIA